MSKWSAGVAIACGLAAVAGYFLAAHPISESGITGASWSPAHDISAEIPDAEKQTGGPVVKVRTAKQLAALKDDLRQRFKDSPAAEQDWALREQAAALLATMTAGEMEAFAKEMIPDPTDGKVSEWNWQRILMREIFRQWGVKDPAGACLGLADTPLGHGDLAFTDWLKRDPQTAREWLAQAQFPPGAEKRAAALRLALVNQEATTDFSAARESLGSLDAEAQKKTLLSWSALVAHDPIKRADFLALLAARSDTDLSEKCYRALIGEMAEKSPAAAAAFVEASDLSEERKNELSHELLGKWAIKDPHQAFAAWAELKENSVPAPLMRAMDSWSLNFPGVEESIAWVGKLDPGPVREQFRTHLIETMTKFERFKQAADLSASLEDPAERIRRLKTVKREWEEKFPQWANEWFGKLSQEDKDAMERNLE